MPYSIREDDMNFCSLCASDKQIPKGKTIIVTVKHLHEVESISFCEEHLLELAEAFQVINSDE